VYCDAVDNVGAKSLDIYSDIFLSLTIGAQINWEKGVDLGGPTRIQFDDSELAVNASTSANVAIAGGKAADGKGERGDVCELVGYGIDAVDYVFGGIVEDVRLRVGNVMSELPMSIDCERELVRGLGNRIFRTRFQSE
jgi:hypothetical protein